MKLNKKGLLAECAYTTTFVGVVVINMIISYAIRHDFRERKALERCELEGAATDCVSYVDGMSRKEILAFIKDTQLHPRQDTKPANMQVKANFTHR